MVFSSYFGITEYPINSVNGIFVGIFQIFDALSSRALLYYTYNSLDLVYSQQ